jgi:hypothetical protein
MFRFLFVVFFFIAHFAFSQQKYVWAKGMGSGQDDFGNAIAVDLSGNVYTTGRFNSGADFDPDTTTVYNLSTSGSIDIFISKLDINGKFVWAKKVGGTSLDEGYGLKLDHDGNVYVTGYFRGTADFDPGPGVHNITASASASAGPDFFVLKLDANGDFVWAKSFGISGWDVGQALTIDTAGNVLITGYYRGVVDFDPGVGIYTLPGSSSNDCIYVLKLDTNGDFIWAKSMHGNDHASALNIACDNQENIYLTGSFSGNIDFNPDTLGAYFLSSSGAKDVFVCKLNQSGNFIWARKMGGSGDDFGTSIAFDSFNNVYTTGNFRGGNADFNPGGGINYLNAQGQNDVFIVKLDSAGMFVWAKQFGGVGYDLGTSIHLDEDDNIYTFGHFWNTVDFDPGTGIDTLSALGGNPEDIFIQKLDNNGDYVWAKRIGDLSNDKCRAATIGPNANLYLTGEFKSTVDFDPDSGVSNLTSKNGSADIFVLKLSCNSFKTMSVSSCDSYVSPSGNYTWYSSNTYLDSLPNFDGCDSLITINLTIDTIDLSINQFGNQLVSNQNGATYQWIDCNNGNVAIVGDTNQTFSPIIDGDYSVIVSLNGCVDTSNCVNVIITGQNELKSVTNHFIYPNPTASQLTIETKLAIKEVVIIDIAGKIIKSIVPKANKIDVSNLSNGIYFIKVVGEEQTIIQKFVKD